MKNSKKWLINTINNKGGIQKMIGKLFTIIVACSAALIFTTGNSFGATYFQDGFESGDKNHAENGFKWYATYGDNGSSSVVVSKDIAHTGSNSLKFVFNGVSSGSDSWAAQWFELGQQLTNIYVRWYQYFPDGTEGLGPKWVQRNESPGNNKWFRVWDEDYTNYNLKGGMSTWPTSSGDSTVGMEYSKTDSGGVGLFNNSTVTGINSTRRGKWICIEVHAKTATSSSASDGALELWIDGVQIRSDKNLMWYSRAGSSSNYFRHGYLMGWANTGFNQTSYTYIDDVVMSSSYIGPAGTSTPPADTTKPSPPTNLKVN